MNHKINNKMCAKLVIFATTNNYASISQSENHTTYDMKPVSLLYNIPPWLITAVVAIIITLLLLLPQPLPDDMYRIQWFEGADKVVHGLMFAALGGAIVTDSRLSKPVATWARANILMVIIIATLASAAYGGLMELAQNWLSLGREGSWGDMAADAIGAAAGSVLMAFVRI